MRYSRFYSFRYILATLTAVVAMIAMTVPAQAFDPSRYAASSRLATGKWVKLRVKQTGLQFISNSQLTQLGFKDPSKVNVYGFGGRMLPELLSESTPDDLPLLPCVRTSRGILFFGTDHIDWKSADTGNKEWEHIQQPYSENSYYFVSDIAVDGKTVPHAEQAPVEDAPTLTTFVARTVHEQDIFAPSNTGRNLLGEDFRSPTTRNFSFNLPDPAGKNATAYMRFAGLATSGWSATLKSASGSGGSATASSSRPSSGQFMQLATASRSLPIDGEKFSIDVTFSGKGTVSLARLDYIEVEWERELRLRDNQLHIYDNATKLRNYSVAGCGSNTVVWDVTNPVSPVQVDYRLEGTNAVFSASGAREFLVFNPEGGYAVENAGSVANQDLHSLPTPDMLIISPKEYLSHARRVAAIHEKEGMIVHVLTPEAIYNEFSSGNPDVSAFRLINKMWHDRAADPKRVFYCLIMSRPTYDNKMVTEAVKKAGYPRVPIWQSPGGTTESSSYSTDDFIGMLDDPTGKTFYIGGTKINAAVGRFPVTSVEEAEETVTKLENYVNSPNYGFWRNNVLLIADDGNASVHLTQSEDVFNALRSAGNGQHFFYDKIYLDTYDLEYSGRGAVYPLATKKLLDKFDEGVLLADYIGHANPYFWGHENLFIWTDITSMKNSNLGLLYAATCEFARWDATDRSGGEMMWKNPEGGVIAMICPSRTVLISSNGVLNRATAARVFEPDADGLPKRMGQFYVEGKNYYSMDENKLRYCFLGDPALRLASPKMRVELESIAGVDLSAVKGNENLPQIKARQNVEISGRVTDPAGNTLEDFNGKVEYVLMDSEKPITTKGNGDDGTVVTFNDRTTRLYTGAANVEKGLWSTTIHMPAEIENNYSPGRLVFYASDSKGTEANGSSERFYVYGYDETAAPDDKGPEIKYLSLNREDYSDGCVVHPTPMVLAEMSDESGINLSDAGIGHKLSLVLDGKTHFDDLNLYYTPDPFDSGAGKLTYPMPELAPGSHTLKLVAWDNANNSSSREISFTVAVAKEPEIFSLSTDCNPAKTSVEFSVSTDRPLSAVECLIEVFDLAGRKVWSSDLNGNTGLDSSIRTRWNLNDKSGNRVERGIYLYRATLISPEGTRTTKTSRLAVTAP